MVDLTNPIFTDEDKAREWLEAHRWADGVFCPHCGGVDKIHRLEGKAHRPGLYQCGECRKQFTVTVGTVFERSKVPLTKWLLASFLLSASKKGMSSHQLHRTLGVTYKTAWFMTHRIREAMRDDGTSPLGGSGKTVEADETYIGADRHRALPATYRNGEGWVSPRSASAKGKRKVVALVERDGRARAFHVDRINAATVRNVLVRNVTRDTALMTDEAMFYRKVGKEFASHERVNHSKVEYVRGAAHTNTIEGYFSIFKRGMKGIYQHCGEKHLHRYLAEFDFRYSNRKISDTERAVIALKGIEGKRLTYGGSQAR